ncbi:MAG: hypothetical protein KA788_13430 [Lacunisphaera sp.]|nr:hypothetical protein [Lacunisphaera sp.]
MKLRPIHPDARVFLAALALCIVVALPGAFTRGTYWDATVGNIHQAVFLHETGFDYHRLFFEEPQYGYGGARTYPFSIYPPAQAALMAVVRHPAAWIALNHLAGFLLAAGCALTAFRIVRENFPALDPRLAAAALATNPFFLSQASAINMEISVLLGGMLGLRAFLRGRAWRAAGWLVAACWIKQSLLPLILVLGVAQLLRARRWRDVPAALGFFAAYKGFTAMEIWGASTLHQAGVVDWNMQSQRLLSWRDIVDFTWITFSRVPDLMLMAFACLIPGIPLLLAAIVAGGLRAPPGLVSRLRGLRDGLRARPALVIGAGCALLALAANLLIKINLPRYVFSAMPGLFLGMVGMLALLPRRVSSGLLALWAALNLVNLHGWIPRTVFSPMAEARGEVPEHLRANGFILERSLEWFADERLQARAARLIEEKYPGRVVVTHWPLMHQFVSPWCGYVRQPLRVMASHWHSMGWAGVRHYWHVYGNETARAGVDPKTFLWVWTDNVFSRPEPSPAGRRTLETLREGNLKIEFYEYDGWPVAK